MASYQGLLEKYLAVPFWRFKPYSVPSLIFAEESPASSSLAQCRVLDFRQSPIHSVTMAEILRESSLFTEWCCHRIIILEKKYFEIICFIAWKYFFSHFGLLWSGLEHHALWNIIVTGCNTLNICVRLYIGIRLFCD